jgi:phospholipid/cholesterol/gamma-HCH transport system substrate-binding protein
MTKENTMPGRLRRALGHLRREPGLGRNVLILGVLVVLGLGVGGYILSQQRFNPPWENTTTVYGTFKESPAIAPGRGNEVRISGVAVGDIRSARVNKQGQAEVLLSIDKSKYPKPVYDNAKLVLRPKSPLNEMYIEMDPGGGPAARPLSNDQVLPLQNSRSPIEIDQPLSHLDDNTRGALRAVLDASDVALARAPTDVPSGLNATDAVVRRLQPVVTELDIRREKIRSLITSVSQLSKSLGNNDNRLGDLANSLQSTLQSVSQRSDALRNSLNQLPGFVDSLHRTTGNVQNLSGQLDPTLDSLRRASSTLPKSLSDLSSTVDTMNTTVDKARPVAQKLPGVAGDLRPFVGDLNAAMPDLKPISKQLNPVTSGLVPYLPDLGGFVYNTASLTSLQDANGGILRGMLVAGPGSVPLPGTTDLSPTQR